MESIEIIILFGGGILAFIIGWLVRNTQRLTVLEKFQQQTNEKVRNIEVDILEIKAHQIKALDTQEQIKNALIDMKLLLNSRITKAS